MSHKFQDKYRISSARLQNWDYANDAIYFVTINAHAHRLNFRFEWQSRFYESIIWNEDSLLKTRKYIEDNVLNWEEDPFRKGFKK